MLREIKFLKISLVLWAIFILLGIAFWDAEAQSYGSCRPGYISVTVGDPPFTYHNVPLTCVVMIYESKPGFIPIGVRVAFDDREWWFFYIQDKTGIVKSYQFSWGPEPDEFIMRYVIEYTPGRTVAVRNEDVMRIP